MYALLLFHCLLAIIMPNELNYLKVMFCSQLNHHQILPSKIPLNKELFVA